MNAYRKGVIWIGTLAVIGTGLFAPWISVWGSTGGLRKPLGYHWLFAPPPEDGAVELDVLRLIIQWSMIAVLTTALFYAVPTRAWTVLWLKRISTAGVLVVFGLALIPNIHEISPTWQKIGSVAWRGILLVLIVAAKEALWALSDRIKELPERFHFFRDEQAKDHPALSSPLQSEQNRDESDQERYSPVENALTYFERGKARAARGDYEGAVEDWTSAKRLGWDFTKHK